jgi:hypothetical protein
MILLFNGYFLWFFIFLFVGPVVVAVVGIALGADMSARLPGMNAAMICPHCQTRGCVTAVSIRRKVGISGGKATAALLTGGVSLLATGLSRKEAATRARCNHCGATWTY